MNKYFGKLAGNFLKGSQAHFKISLVRDPFGDEIGTRQFEFVKGCLTAGTFLPSLRVRKDGCGQ